ncbi:MAG: peptide-methionine (R)-S-oxide reductase MsrB [Candidatus Caldarchaeum sp.]
MLRIPANLGIMLVFLLGLDAACTHHTIEVQATRQAMSENNPEVPKNEEEWRAILTPEEYHVLREKGTEPPFTGKYWNHTEEGLYLCAGCGAELFRSSEKFDAHCGWPSFFDVANPERVRFQEDYSFGMRRIEVLCARCGGHLGHVFPDGPPPTGLRYCINSVSLRFQKEKDEKSG